ncbi:MAG: hypothetical protein EKK37_12090 [Sphingobacteriales bacterium]|nr:MAG: hypothetical protein EKK37_12090 [Sphingobacteriales bacterium]
MKKKFILIPSLIIFSLMLLSYKEFIAFTAPDIPVIIKGTVIDYRSDEPVTKALVATVKGEEESLTNNKGEFRIESWENFPITVSVFHKDYQPVELTINSANKPVVIKIIKK